MDIAIPAATSVEVWGGITDRRSIADLRLGVDGSQTFGIGQQAYQRSKTLMLRGFASREIADGRGEWEAEASYSKVVDSVTGMDLGCAFGGDVKPCYGWSNNTIVSGGGQVFYRLKQDWLAIATVYLLRITNRRSDMTMEDPPVTGITGFLRIAKRF
jgi:hypothetical protein